MRNVSDASKAILKNKDAIAVSQDSLGQMGIRIVRAKTNLLVCPASDRRGALGAQTPDIPQQIWARVLANGDVAVALYNKGDSAMPHQPPIPTGPCTKWTETQHGYYEAAGGPGGNVGTFSGKTVAEAKAACCANPKCTSHARRFLV